MAYPITGAAIDFPNIDLAVFAAFVINDSAFSAFIFFIPLFTVWKITEQRKHFY